jgi:CHASE3 domain sensor protein
VVLEKLDGVLSDLLNAEIALRDYSVTGNESYLDAYRDAVGPVLGHVNELRKLGADNPVRQRALDRLETLISVKGSSFTAVLPLVTAKAGSRPSLQVERGEKVWSIA